MELHHLRTFVIVADEASVTKAAQRLYMTPPTISGHIKALENELSVNLFIRTTKGMQLTEKGKLLKLKAEKTLDAAQDLVNHATELQAHLIGQLTFGLNASPDFLQVAALATILASRCPGIDLHLHSTATGNIIEALQNQMIDVGYIFGAAPTSNIHTHSLGHVDLLFAAPKTWESELKEISWADIASRPWITSDIYCPFQTITDNLFQSRGLEIEHRIRANNESMKLNLVKEGLGMALLVGAECRHSAAAGEIIIWKTEPIQCELNFAYLVKRKNDPLIVALDEIVRGVWQG